MSEDYHPPTKTDLLKVIQAERERLAALFEGLTDAQMTEAGVEAAWSIKDILAHMAAWERLAADRLHAAVSEKPLKFSLIRNDADVDKFNAEVFARHQHQTLSEIKQEYEAAHADFSAQIEKLDESLLPQPLPFDWAGKLTFQVVISANTHWHYAEHAAAIEKWLETIE